jgi:ABC-2 type transport system ATP-binding protein
MVCGLIPIDSGSIELFGNASPRKSVHKIGYMPQSISIYEELTAYENIFFFGKLYGVSTQVLKQRSDSLLKRMQLEDRGADLVGTFSGGMKRRLMLASALIHDPDLLILDEPTSGVDPRLRVDFWDWIRSLADDGKAVLITTHHISEASRCNEIAFINNGRIFHRGVPETLMKEHGVSDLESVYIQTVEDTQ